MHLLAFVPGSMFYQLAHGGIPMMIAVVVIILQLGLAFLFLRTMAKMLKVIAPENRKIKPSKVWWQILPYINVVIFLFVMQRVSRSIKMECAKRGVDVNERITWIMGFIYGVTGTVTNTLAMADNYVVLPVWLKWVSVFVGVTGMVAWIIYWVQINGYKRKFRQPYVNDSMIFGQQM